MDTSETSRMLGDVQGAIRSLSLSMERVLDNQETARRDIIDASDKLHTKLDEHATSDTEAFAQIRTQVGEGLGGLRDRISQLEPLIDRIESHGDAITSLEKRLGDAAIARDQLAAAHALNRRWIQGIIGLAGTVAGAAGATHGATVLKWLQTLAH